MRSRLFEEALIQTKLQAVLSSPIKKEQALYPKGASGWLVGNVFREDRLDIIEEVLVFCRKPQTRKDIAQTTNLDTDNLYGCIEYMLSQGLLLEYGSQFLTTDKGETLLKLFVKLRGFFGIDPLE
ncbi:MAG: winged helix-turn-helix domain-containing protein [Candidatus Bathyarchaeota archaeon]|nr:winged helix-turn-helix domain-containing protein [Candidatus Bathyarchaeota archaeon]